MPYVGICISFATRYPKQWLDSGFPCCRPKRIVTEEEIATSKDEWVNFLEMPEEEWDPPQPRIEKITKLNTISQYTEMYGGPDYILYS
jgi:hypothetical protein